MARLDHPNIVRVYGGCLRPPRLFVVEEIAVGDLAAHIHKRQGGGAMALKEIISIALDVIRGLVRAGPIMMWIATDVCSLSLTVLLDASL